MSELLQASPESQNPNVEAHSPDATLAAGKLSVASEKREGVPASVELTFTSQDNEGETFTDVFTPVTTVKDETEHETRRILTNEPKQAFALIEKGPRALDGLGETGPTNITFLQTIEYDIELEEDSKTANVTLFPIRINPDKTFTVLDYQQGEVEAPDQWPETETLQASEYNKTKNTPSSIEGLRDNGTNFDRTEVYKKSPALRNAYAKLGIDKGEKKGFGADITLPTPNELKRRLTQLRETEDGKGLYYPKITFMDSAQIDNLPYIRAFADKQYPVAVGDFEYYGHDIATEHLEALIAGGEPLMEFMASFCQEIVSDPLPTHFSNLGLDGRAGDLEGEAKIERAAIMVDRLTMGLGKAYISRANHIKFIAEQNMVPICEDMITVLRASGRLESLELIQTLLQSGKAGSPDEITGAMVADQLVDNARQALGITAEEPRLSKEKLAA